MSWRDVSVGEVCDLSTGGTPSKENTEYFDNGDILWLVSGDIHKREIFDCNGRITELGYKNSNAKFLPIDSVLIALNGQGKTRGTVALLRVRATCNQSIVAITPKNKDELDSKYLFYYLDGKYEYIRRLTGDSGNDRRGLNMPLIRKISLPLPPLLIQQKIVTKLDAIFADIHKATAAAEANAKNADALFQSYLTEVFDKNYDNYKKLKDCCLIKPPKSELKNIDNLVVSFMPMEALGINSKYAIPNQIRKLSDVSGSYTYFAEGDVLLAKITPCFENGKLGIAKELKNMIGFGSSEYIVFRPMKEVDSRWLYYFLNRNEFRLDGAKHMSGAVGHKRVTKEFIEDSVLPLPTLAKQKELVNYIENISSVTKSLELSSKNKSNQLKLLKQSILTKAFNGELVKD